MSSDTPKAGMIGISMADATSLPERLPALDGFRAIAALMVYVYHAWQGGGMPTMPISPGGKFALGGVFDNLRAGVDLFMVLSGFCLFWPTVRNPATLRSWSWRNFARRRILRIVPPYYASIVFAAVLPFALVIFYRALGRPAKWQSPPDFIQLVTHLTFTHTLFPQTWGSIQGVYWSLGLEAQFYLVFPLVIWGYKNMGIRVVWYMVGSSVVYRAIVGILTLHSNWVVNFLWSITFLGRWMEFAAGMFAAWLVCRDRERKLIDPSLAYAILLGSVVAYGLATLPGHTSAAFLICRDLLLSGCFAGAIVAACTSGLRLRKCLEWKPLTKLGLISYSVFLTHQVTSYYFSEFFSKVLHVQGATEFVLLLTVVFAAVVVFAYLFFLAFERPFLHKRVRAAIKDQAFMPAGQSLLHDIAP